LTPGTTTARRPGDVGAEYLRLVDLSKETIADLGTIFPEYAGSEFRLMGVGWHQGWNDRVNQECNDAYEENLSNLIRDLRKELGVPELPFVIAETGMTGPNEKHPRALSLMVAQKAVAERPEFRRTVQRHQWQQLVRGLWTCGIPLQNRDDGGRQGCRETTLISVDLEFGLKTARRSTPVPHSPAWP
jgi:hypothetical protein